MTHVLLIVSLNPHYNKIMRLTARHYINPRRLVYLASGSAFRSFVNYACPLRRALTYASRDGASAQRLSAGLSCAVVKTSGAP